MSRRLEVGALLCLAGLVLTLMGPAILGWAGLPQGDFIDQFYAFASFASAELAAGRLPLWNPYTFSGHPFLADIQSGVLYPPNLVMLLLAALTGGRLPLWALYVQVAVHLFLAGAFTYALARHLLVQRGAALLAAIAFTLSGYLTSYPPLQLAILQTNAWLPLLLLQIDLGLKTKDLGLKTEDLELKTKDLRLKTKSQILKPQSSIFSLQSLVFNLQSSIFSLQSLVFLGFVWAMVILPGHPQSVMYVGYAALAWAVYRAWASGRGWWRGVWIVAGSVGVGLGLTAAQWLPSLEYMRLSVRAAASYDRLAHGFPFRDLIGLVAPGVVSLWSPLYVGLVPLGLACLAMLRSRQDHTRFWMGLGLVALLLSFGGGLFVYTLFYLLIPGFNLFQSQERAAFLVSFSLAMLAGIGWQASFATRQRRLGVFLIGLTAFDLLRVAAPLLIGPPVPADLGYSQTLVQPMQTAAGPVRVENEYRLPANWGVLAGVEDTWGASPLRTQHYADFYAAVPPERRRRLLNVGFFLTWHGDVPGMSEIARQAVTHPVNRAAETTFLLKTEPGPRAWLVYNVEVVDDAVALARLADSAFDPWRIGLLGSGPASAGYAPPSSQPPTAGISDGSVQALRLSPTHIAVDVDTPQAGWLILSEVWYPGWTATVNGVAAPVARCHVTLMAVPVTAGAQRVELRFDPPIVKFGLAVSLTTIILGMILWGWGWRRVLRSWP